MDKETLSNYGWIVICVLVLAVMIALATPFGKFVSNAVQNTTQGLFDVNQKALNQTGLITIEDQEFDVPDGTGNGGNDGETPEAPVTPVTYNMTEGNNANVTYATDITFRSDADFAKFVGVKVDGNDVAPENYTAVSGSTVVTLKADYVKTLTNDNHTIEIISNDGKATATFNVDIAKANIITFTIAGISYQAEEGMTWDAWEKSEYYDDEKFSRIGYGTTDTLLSYDYEIMREVVVSNPNGRYILIEETITNGTQYLLIKNDGSTD